MKAVNRIGIKYGRLLVVSINDSLLYAGRKRIFWNCMCECGIEVIAESGRLQSGYTKSCGCLKSEVIGNLNRTHSDSKTKEYRAWSGIKSRCYNTLNAKYYAYGARGIKVCERWINSFDNFLLDIGRAPSKEHSIDRKNVNGNYEPLNCHWATSLEQANNKRQTVWVDLNGNKVSMKQWSNYYKLPYKKVHALHKYKNLSFPHILKQLWPISI